jgi:hypothetical protein
MNNLKEWENECIHKSFMDNDILDWGKIILNI